MKLLIVSQSSESGTNRELARIIADRLSLRSDKLMEIEYANADNAKEAFDVDHQIWIVPEWNTSFPHTFKALIDNSGWPSKLRGKYILLIGTSETTFGNLLGITHLEHILKYMGANVSKNTVHMPHLSKTIEDAYTDERLVSAINKFVD